jgi:hypothetical protein
VARVSKFTDTFLSREKWEGSFTLYDVEELLYYTKKQEEIISIIKNIMNCNEVGPGKYKHKIMAIQLLFHSMEG